MNYETKNTNQNWTINRRVFPCTNLKVIMSNIERFYQWLQMCQNIYLNDNDQVVRAFHKIAAK